MTTPKKRRQKNQTAQVQGSNTTPTLDYSKTKISVLCESIRERAGGRFNGLGRNKPPKTLGDYLAQLEEVRAQSVEHEDDDPIGAIGDLPNALQDFIGSLEFGVVFLAEGMWTITEEIDLDIERLNALIAIVGPSFPLERV